MAAPRSTRALLLALAALACGRGAGSAGATPWPGRNLLANPGFEQDRTGWSIREQSPHWGDFRVVDDPVRTGRGAVHLALAHGETLPPRPVKVYGVVQALHPERLPETVGGFYRVERWEPGAEATDLYLQVVAIVWLGRPEGLPGRPVNHQLRYYLAGISEPPFLLANARVTFVSRGAPVMGKWCRFELPLRADFERLWGQLPEHIDKLDVLFEARWDNMPPHSAVRADVYYDDLFVGEGTGNASAAPAGPGC
jgi:hypothetical protein